MSNLKKLLLWLLVSSLLGAAGLTLGMKVIIPGPSSKAPLLLNSGERIALDHNLAPNDGLIVIVSSLKGNIDDSSGRQAINKLITRLKALRMSDKDLPLFTLIESAHDSLSLDSETLISEGKTYALVIAQSRSPIFRSSREFSAIPDTLLEWHQEHPEFKYGYLSHATGESEVLSMIARDLDRSLIYTTPITLLILIWAFRSIIAALIPLIIAAISLISSLGLSAIVSHYIGEISATASQLVVLLVLAIGVDYSLFFITRAREEMAIKNNLLEAIHITRKTTGVAIFWSGLIVSISLVGLLLMNDTVLNSMAIVSIISVLTTLTSCLYALPPLLALFPSSLKVHPQLARKDSGRSLTEWSLRTPIISATILLSVLLFFSYFMLQINLGNTMTPDTLPQSLQSMRTYKTLEQEFPDKAGGDISLILYGRNLQNLEDSGEISLALEQIRTVGLRGPIKTEVSEDFQVERFKLLTNGNGNDLATKEIVRTLTDQTLPNIFEPLNIEAHLGGVIPYTLSEAQKYLSRMPIVFATVLGLSFIFLLIAFRSIIIPIKAIVLNMLSTSASFGILVLVFQYFPQSILYTEVIESFVPPLLFTILFGLSMDYHVFMLSRISEEFHKTRDSRASVRIGIRQTSRTITSAALIMMSVFLVAATLKLPVMRQLGIGLAVAVLIDATLIRTILLPATMLLLGQANWYLPKWLRFLPRVSF